MFFVSLFMSLAWMFGGSMDIAASGGVFDRVYGPYHAVHGHRPGPPNGHSENTTHQHHGTHGHSVPLGLDGGHHNVLPHSP
ncbi:MAG: hypothetical protein HY236_03360 [Acidobacteria bacterium]|nr:hypothetical protein [Acidobacteriota bacterium]